MQIMRPATDVAYELRFYDVPVAYLFCIHGLCVVYMLRCCGKSFLCVAFLYGLSLVPVFFVLVKYTLNACVPIAYQAIKLRLRYLPAALLSIARRRCDVCMVNRSCYERAAIFLKTSLKKLPHP